jgi:alkanesulfonate monooxygenase SsuD/methylene tetrahydromethanopterin reductase-like flavin-dependent oxidoreductase (luciferase family)
MTGKLEIAWFSALCDDDYEFLGRPDPALASSWEHCRNIVLRAEEGGFDNILLPSGYQLGLDTTAFASAIATLTSRIKLLMAVRIGESWPPQLARQIATLDQIANGRLNINIISSDLPGEKMDSEPRYRRTVEAMHILKTLLNGEHLSHQGEHYNIEIDPPRMKTFNGKCPPLYFGGLSPAAREAAAEGCDVYLMWPETLQGAACMSWCAKPRRRRAHTPTGFCPNSMPIPGRRSAINRSTRKPSASHARPNCAKRRRRMKAISRIISGPALAARVPAAALRSSAIPIRCWPS